MNNHSLLQITDLKLNMAGNPVLQGVNLNINAKQCFAITGAAGSGKSSLLRAIAGKCFYHGTIQFAQEAAKRCALIGQQHFFRNLSNTGSFYYQQRFNSADASDSCTVNDALQKISTDQHAIDEQLQQLGITHVKDIHLIKLSNGEHKRVQLAKALLQRANWLLLDSPYTGLDSTARKLLDNILGDLVSAGKHILLVAAANDIPDCVTHVAVLAEGKTEQVYTRKAFLQQRTLMSFEHHHQLPAFTATHPEASEHEFSVAIKMVDTSVHYGERKILDNINWEVKKGERWSISGHNGSGKSTLLSLVNGDNPQAFANAIWLFDRRKGTGETIWDIKKKIGYLSPELHHYFDASIVCWQVVASGLFDTVGLFRKVSQQQLATVNQWLLLMGLESFSGTYFNQLSNGQQRLVLLARALVKNPPLLILDEPCQGLDAPTSAKFIALVDQICIQLNKTLVYVTHYESEVPSCVTYQLKLENGSIAA